MTAAQAVATFVFLAGESCLAHLSAGNGDPQLWWQVWSLSPVVLASLLAASCIYAIGFKRLGARQSEPARKRRGQAIAFYSGIGALFVALVSPVDSLSESLGAVHMLQHTLLMMVGAPLIALGSPGYVALWAVPSGAWPHTGGMRRGLSQILRLSRFSRPLALWALYAVTLWLWHLPKFYEAALSDPLVHDLQHLMFFLTSYLFWRVLLDPFAHPGLNAGAGLLYLFVASLHAMVLGTLMALSPSAWYAPYFKTAPLFGLSALEDQQLAGYIMWMPAGITYIAVAVVLGARLLREKT